MLVISKTFDLAEVLSKLNNQIELKEYVRSLIPKELQHNTSILSNQMFYIGTQLVENKELDLETKDKVVSSLMCNVHVCGYLDSFVFMDDVDPLLDWERIRLIHERS